MRRRFLVLGAILLFFAAVQPASAQRAGTDFKPGDSCAGTVTGASHISPDPTGNTAAAILFCNGTTWEAGGFQLGNDSAGCTADKEGTIRYTGASPPWQYCNGSAWVNFKQPRCTDDDTGECYLDAPRSNDDPDFVAANIADGINILGVTGTLDGAEPDCTNDSTAVCTLAATRSDSDPQFIASNILCGANILGVVGTGGTVNSPNAFSFTDQTDRPNSGFTSSNIVQITGLSCPVTVSISGDGTPQYQICNDAICSSVDHTFTTVNGTIDNNQYLQLLMWNSTSYSTTHTATVTVHDVSDDWSVTTEDPPVPFSGKRVFVTSTQYSTNLGGVAGADSICATRASAAGLSGTFLAWIADGNNSSAPDVRFTKSSGPYGLVGTYGPQIADDWADLTDGLLDNPINIDEFGNSQSFGNVMTNVKIDGTRSDTNHCNGWASTSFSYSYVRGDLNSSGFTWTRNTFTAGCSSISSQRLYCFEQ